MKSISLKTLIRRYTRGVVIVLLFLLLSLVLSTTSQLYEKIKQQENNNLQLISYSLSTSLDKAARSIHHAQNSMSFIFIGNTAQKEIVKRHLPSFQKRVYPELTTYDEYCGMYIMNEDADSLLYLPYIINGLTPSRQQIVEIIQDISEMDHEKTTSFSVFTINDHIFAGIYTIQNHSISLFLFDPEYNESFKAFNLNADKELPYVFETEPVKKGLMGKISAKVPGLELYAARNLPFSLGNNINIFQIAALVLMILTIVLIPIIIFRYINKTNDLISTINSGFSVIEKGNLDYRLEIDSRVTEVQDFTNSFNHMIEEIQTSEQELFENRIIANSAKLQYLQLQIRPHFYLNCLKNLYAMLELSQVERSKTFIINLSHYFEHSFRDVRSFLPLSEELEATQTYIDLCNDLDRNIQLEYRLDSDTLDVSCLPLSVLTFVENAVKHSVNADPLHILITASLKTIDDDQKILITIENDGGAFDEDVLNELNSANASEIEYRRKSIGIPNVRFRLWLVYRERASVSFSNDNDRAIVNVMFPV